MIIAGRENNTINRSPKADSDTGKASKAKQKVQLIHTEMGSDAPLQSYYYRHDVAGIVGAR